MVLAKIEKSDSYSGNTFVDRYGVNLYTDNLCTGSKILLSVAYYPQYIFNAIELGYNAAALLGYIEEGNVYISDRSFNIDNTGRLKSICVDGRMCKDIDQVNFIIGD